MAQYIFPKLDIKPVKRSGFDLSTNRSTSLAPGLAVPIYMRSVLPNDRFVVDLTAGLESFPLTQPTNGRWRLRFDFHFVPLSNMYGWMDNDERRTSEQIMTQKLHSYTLNFNGRYENSDNEFRIDQTDGVQPGSVWNYFGWPAGYLGKFHNPSVELSNKVVYVGEAEHDYDVPYVTTAERSMEFLNAHKPFAYLDIIRSFYVNNQENVTYFMGESSRDGLSLSSLKSVDLQVLDDVMMSLRQRHDFTHHSTLSGCLNTSWMRETDDLARFDRLDKFMSDWEKTWTNPLGGLFAVPYPMDLYRGVMNVDTNDYKAVISVVNGQTSIDHVRFQNRMQESIDLLSVSSGRFTDWTKMWWTVDIKGKIDKPIYLGSRSEYIQSADVIATASSEDTELGQQAGFAVGGLRKGRRISFNSDQYGIFCCIATLVPEVNYSQGFEADDLRTLFLDMYQPNFANVGFVDVPAKEMYALVPISRIGIFGKYRYDVTSDWNEVSRFTDYTDVEHQLDPNTIVGRRLAFADYMTDVDRSYGLFSQGQSLSEWVLNRSYTNSVISDVRNLDFDDYSQAREITTQSLPSFSTYVDPLAYNDLFADTSSTAQNFRLFCHFGISAKRAIPKRRPPHI